MGMSQHWREQRLCWCGYFSDTVGKCLQQSVVVQDLIAETSSPSPLDKGSAPKPELSQDLSQNKSPFPLPMPTPKHLNNVTHNTPLPLLSPLDPVSVVPTLLVSSRPLDTADLDLPVPLAPTEEPPPSKSHLCRLRRRTIRLHPFTLADAEKTLLTFRGSVNGHPAHVLIDGGAEGNVISSSFAKRFAMPLTTAAPTSIIGPDGSITIANHTAAVTLAHNSYCETFSALPYPLKKYDLVLGKPWLARINPNIHWGTNDLYFNHNGTPVHWDCRGFAPTSVSAHTRRLLLSHLHFPCCPTW
jgi:hypothetical protein